MREVKEGLGAILGEGSEVEVVCLRGKNLGQIRRMMGVEIEKLGGEIDGSISFSPPSGPS